MTPDASPGVLATAPRLMFLLSVADTIRLEYSFHLVPDPTASR